MSKQAVVITVTGRPGAGSHLIKQKIAKLLADGGIEVAVVSDVGGNEPINEEAESLEVLAEKVRAVVRVDQLPRDV